MVVIVCVKTGIRTPQVGIYFSKANRNIKTNNYPTVNQVLSSIKMQAKSNVRKKAGTTKEEKSYLLLEIIALQRKLEIQQNSNCPQAENRLPN